jgi:hypothetical protein
MALKRIRITIYLSPEVAEKILKLLQQLNCSQQSVIAIAIAKGLASMSDQA